MLHIIFFFLTKVICVDQSKDSLFQFKYANASKMDVVGAGIGGIANS
jgi:hypothetical protein